ncbi:hypothetical protein, partial [Escherichia coli]|uniref:hypothetical protein n=1 Tax=Escherichia coli TaxID=562 RepID=UPI002FF09204
MLFVMNWFYGQNKTLKTPGLGEPLDATYLGDMIGAQAIRRMAAKQRYFSFGIIQGLLSIEPYKEPIKNGFFTLA